MDFIRSISIKWFPCARFQSPLFSRFVSFREYRLVWWRAQCIGDSIWCNTNWTHTHTHTYKKTISRINLRATASATEHKVCTVCVYSIHVMPFAFVRAIISSGIEKCENREENGLKEFFLLYFAAYLSKMLDDGIRNTISVCISTLYIRPTTHNLLHNAKEKYTHRAQERFERNSHNTTALCHRFYSFFRSFFIRVSIWL